MFSVLGSPNEDTWPGVTKLPYYKDVLTNQMNAEFGKIILLRGPGFELLQMMLMCNPSQRISAKRILKHKYFNFLDPKKLYPPLPKLNAIYQSCIAGK